MNYRAPEKHGWCV